MKKGDECDRDGSLRKFDQITGNIDEVIFIFSPDWQQAIYVSPAYEKIWGRDIEDVYRDSLSWLEAVVPDDRERVAAIVDGQATGKIPYEASVEYRIETPDRTTRWISVRTYPVKDANGTTISVAGIATDVTGRKSSEERLLDSERFLNNFFDCFQDGISILDKDLNIVRVNHLIEKWHGYMMPLEGKKCYKVYHGRSTLCEKCPSIRAMELGTSQSEVVPLEVKDGARLGWLEIFSFPFRDNDGNIIGVIEHVRDITRRKEAEDALRDSEEKYRSLVENINDMVWEMDADFRVTYASPRTRDIMGYEVEEVMGKRPFDFILQDDLDRFGSLINEAVRTRAPLELMGYRAVRKDGRVIYMETNGMPIFNRDGSNRGYRGINRDITERKRAEEALKESEEKFRILAETTGAGIVLYMGKNFVYVNPTFEKITGYTREEFLKMNYWDVVHPDSKELVRGRGMARQRGLKVPSTYEFKIVTKDGEIKWVEISAAVISYAGMQMTLATIFDITSRKRSEKELQEAKGQAELYLDLMGHDINNMNQIGIGFLEQALSTLKLDRESRELIAKPLEALEASTRLIANVRKLQKIKDGGLKFHEINVGEMISGIIPRYRDVGGREISIRYAGSAGCKVIANDLLDDVFSNIIGNAIKHSSGPLTIDVDVSDARVGGRKYCIVAIQDDGPGIPDDLKERLFTRHERGKTRSGGRGLGLYLVKMLVEDFHGKAWVEDRVQGDHTKGTRLMIMLPAVE